MEIDKADMRDREREGHGGSQPASSQPESQRARERENSAQAKPGEVDKNPPRRVGASGGWESLILVSSKFFHKFPSVG